MLTFHRFFTQPLPIFTGMVVFGTSIFGAIPVLAQEKVIFEPKPLETVTGTIQDLQGIEPQAIAGESANLGEGNFPTLELNSSSDSAPTFYEVKTEALNLTLENKEVSVGDLLRVTRRFPVVQF